MAIEGSFYEWKDILCLTMDMMGVEVPHFTLADIQSRYYYAPHFFNIFTNCTNFKQFIERDTFITPVVDPYTDFFRFYKRLYDQFVNGCQEAEPEVEDHMLLKD